MKMKKNSKIKIGLKAKSLFKLSTVSFFLASSLSATGWSSDHIDFPGGLGNSTNPPRVLDLSDLFAWVPSPGRITLGLNTHLAATEGTLFSTDHIYRFRVRTAKVSQAIPTKLNAINAQDGSTEVTIDCSFITGTNQTQTATCRSNGFSVSNEVNDDRALGSATNGNIKLFAGLRADPFILDIKWGEKFTRQTFAKPAKTNPLPLKLESPENFSDYLNILNITLELDLAKLFPDTKVEFIAVAAEVINPAPSNGVSPIIDRVGRPEMTNMTIRLPDYKPLYNEADVFNMEFNKGYLFMSLIGNGVLAWDLMDHKRDWSTANLEVFRKTLVNDYLVVNLNGECLEENEAGKTQFKKSYLDIELNKRNENDQGAFKSCGGRTPTEDIVDTLVSYYVGGPEAKVHYGDGVDQVKFVPTTSWPYFAPPFKAPPK